MDIGSLLILCALLILVGLYISQPLIARKAVVGNLKIDKYDHDLSTLLAEKERILEALDELDSDHELGKIPEAEYPVQRGEMLKRGADILRQLDSMPAQPHGGNMEASIETAIAARRAISSHIPVSSASNDASDGDIQHQESKKSEMQVASADDALEMRIASRRRDRQSKSGGFCPQCGKPLQTSDRFCPKCGKELA
jgi:hypothetical protein